MLLFALPEHVLESVLADARGSPETASRWLRKTTDAQSLSSSRRRQDPLGSEPRQERKAKKAGRQRRRTLCLPRRSRIVPIAPPGKALGRLVGFDPRRARSWGASRGDSSTLGQSIRPANCFRLGGRVCESRNSV